MDQRPQTKEVEIETDLYDFFTIQPNSVVESIHKKAMPVILTTREEVVVWFRRHGTKQRLSRGRCQAISSYSSHLPDSLLAIAPLAVFQFVLQWAVSRFGDDSDTQEPPDGEVSIICQRGCHHPDSHVIGGATPMASKWRHINGPVPRQAAER